MYLQLTDGTIVESDSPQYWTEAKPLSAKAGKAAKQAQSARHLRKWLKPGATAYTILRHVSSSGMSRRISVVVIQKHDGKPVPVDVSGYVADVLDCRRHERDGSLIVGGCGMDMGFHLIYSLSRRLFPKGFKVNGVGRNGDTSGHDSDGGYALKQAWL